MKKRLTATILVIALICTMLPTFLLAANAADSVTWSYDASTRTISFSGKGELKKSSEWEDYRISIQTAIIGDGITAIGSYTFTDCISLNTVILGNSVTKIGDSAFSGCKGLKSINFPDSLVSIGISAFKNCAGLPAIDTNNVSIINGNAFINCTGIKSVTFRDCLTSIGSNAFNGCTGLSEIVIPDSVTSLDGNYVFAYCSALEKVTIGNGVTQIPSAAFYYCNKLREITMGDNIVSIGSDAFRGCISLPSVSLGNSIIIGDRAFYECNGLKSITFPDSLAEIGNSAFKKCVGLEKINTNNVTTLGSGAFSNCTGLITVTFGERLSRIGSNAFEGCIGLSEVVIPDNVTSLDGGSTFYGCSGLQKVTIGNSISKIPVYTFSQCTQLESIYLGTAISSITNVAFSGCTALTDVYYPGTETEWNKVANESKIIASAYIHFGTQPHAYTDVVTAPTCTEKGYTSHICTCGIEKIDTYVDALGHSYVRGVCYRCGEIDPNYKPITFIDVPQNAWYFDAVDFAVGNGLMNGVGNYKFDPEGSMTRAMLVTVLWRYEGSPKKGTNSFTDVPNGQWYTNAIAWAAAEGIVGGVGNGKFEPDGNITREQMATILFRYANKKGFDTGKRGNLSSFPDASKVSSYAKDALSWTVAEKIINGSDGYLLPQGNATRAQVAAILMRYIQNIAEAK